MTFVENAEMELPEGWEETTLDAVVADAIGGDWGYPPEEADGIKKIAVAVIRGTEFRDWDTSRGKSAAIRAVDLRKLEKRRLRAGDFVLEVSGGGPHQSVGRTALIDGHTLSQAKLPLICSNFCRRIRLRDVVLPAFGWWALRWRYSTGDFERFQTQTTNLRNLNVGEFLSGVILPIPPLAEQKRIVAKVEELLARVNAARERLAKVPTLLKRFRQSVLAAACSGQLTADWREDNVSNGSAQSLLDELASDRVASRSAKSKLDRPSAKEPAAPLFDVPEGWAWATLSQIVQEGRPIIYGIIKPGPHVPDGIPYVRVTEMKDGFVDVPNLRRASKERADKFARATLAPGDLLISKDGTIGRVAVVPPELKGGNITQHLVRAPIHPLMNREYVVAAIRAPATQKWLTEEKLGVALQGVNVEDFRRLPVAVPAIEEQREIVRRVEALFSLADKIEARLHAATARVEKITQSILAKAFRGELVPTEAQLARQEGRDYEPASALLERIRRERETGGLPALAARTAPQPPAPVMQIASLPAERVRPVGVWRKRGAMAAYLIDRLHDSPAFGRVELEKGLYLTETLVGIDLAGQYKRMQFGPLDPDLYYLEELAKKPLNRWFTANEAGGKVTYVPGERIQQSLGNAVRMLGPKSALMERLVAALRKMNTEQAEVFATVFAAWNDFLIDSKQPTDEEIIREVRENWHPKKQKFSSARLQTCIHWIRKEKFVPRGCGPRTIARNEASNDSQSV